MTNKLLEEHAVAYAKLSGMTLNLKSPLGYGNDGSVWKTSKNSAVKAIENERKYTIEAECYKRFAKNGITKIDGFAVPQLFGCNDDLLVIEMGIVTAPYILDFAKGMAGPSARLLGRGAFRLGGGGNRKLWRGAVANSLQLALRP
jgi:hypothetical protein